MSRVAIGSGDDDYNRQLEATLSDMIYTYDRTFGFDENESRQDTTDIASAAAAAKKPFGTLWHHVPYVVYIALTAKCYGRSVNLLYGRF
jgi:hypothetical protein